MPTNNWGSYVQSFGETPWQDVETMGLRLNLHIHCTIHYPAYGKNLFECQCGIIFPAYVVKAALATNNWQPVLKLHTPKLVV